MSEQITQTLGIAEAGGDHGKIMESIADDLSIMRLGITENKIREAIQSEDLLKLEEKIKLLYQGFIKGVEESPEAEVVRKKNRILCFLPSPKTFWFLGRIHAWSSP